MYKTGRDIKLLLKGILHVGSYNESMQCEDKKKRLTEVCMH